MHSLFLLVTFIIVATFFVSAVVTILTPDTTVKRSIFTLSTLIAGAWFSIVGFVFCLYSLGSEAIILLH